MRSNYLLSVSIPIGMLLSSCCCDTAVMQSSDTGDKLHVAAIKFLKHNQGIEGPKQRKMVQKSARQSTAFICVHLVPTSDGNGQEIEYWITDMNGTSGAKHSRDSGNNETVGSDLFTTTFAPGANIDVVRADGEVIIKGKAADGTRHAWKSDSTKPTIGPNDSDVIWASQ
jgi:hypothetical protein